ncbi:MAG: DUF3883 domain-containing protein, partial [Thermoanaerobaculum sp.]|nr:DUF3883 domain-containing protein [Thermoanaerobaculum sp.]
YDETRKLKGLPVPEAEIIKEQRRKEEYQRRKEQLAEDSRRDTSLTLAPPELLGVARILPQPATQLPPVSDAQVEAVGMQVAMDYERQQGRTPEDVSARKVGYDIRSTDPKGGVRYIEVKARAVSGPITLTPNEWLMAQRLGEDYWLYVVEHAATTPTLYPIQHPAAKLQPVEVSQVVRYVVEDWRSAAAPS